MNKIQASTFKAKCLALLDHVAETGEEYIVTKHNVPVAKLVPIDLAPPTLGTVQLLAEDDSEYFSTDENWDNQ